MDIKEIKNFLTIQEIYKILSDLGAEPEFNNGNIISKTICHNGDSHKLYYYSDSKLFHCYTECAESFDLPELITKYFKNNGKLNWSFYDTVSFLEGYIDNNKSFTFTKENFNNDIIDSIEHYYFLLNKKIDIVSENKYYDNKILQNLPFLPCWNWIKEGISIDVMKKYGIKYYPTNARIVIPHWDKDNNLVGIRGRVTTEEDEKYGKYSPIIINSILYNHPLSQHLYGLNFNINNIKNFEKVIIFESEKSVMQYESMFPNANISVAVCGSSISNKQIDLLIDECKVKEIIIAFDRQFKELLDDEYKKDVNLLCKLAHKMNNFCNVSIIFDKFNLLDYKDSPTDKGKDIFLKLYNNRIYYKEGIV